MSSSRYDHPATYRLSTFLSERAGAILVAEMQARRARGQNRQTGASQHDVIADALERAFGRKYPVPELSTAGS